VDVVLTSHTKSSQCADVKYLTSTSECPVCDLVLCDFNFRVRRVLIFTFLYQMLLCLESREREDEDAERERSDEVTRYNGTGVTRK
jgi:hypothetical protein